MAAASPAGLYWVVKQVVCQPLQVTVTHKGVLSQMAVRKKRREEKTIGMSRKKVERNVLIVVSATVSAIIKMPNIEHMMMMLYKLGV